MLKNAINFDDKSSQPSWASNFFKHFDEFSFIMRVCYKSKRKNIIARFNEEKKYQEELKYLSFNKKGRAIFFWDSYKEKTFFLLKWS